MGNISELWNSLKVWMAGRSRRELALLTASAIVVTLFIADRTVYAWQAQRLAQANQQLQSTQLMLTAAQSALEKLQSGAAANAAEGAAQAELAELRKQVRLIDAVMSNAKGSAPAIGALIKNLIATQHPRVTLLSLKTLPPRALSTLGQGLGAAKGGQELYRQGVELELAGAYLDLLAYLRSLESGSQGLLWSDARLAAANFPEVTLRVTIYIVSNRSDAFLS